MIHQLLTFLTSKRTMLHKVFQICHGGGLAQQFDSVLYGRRSQACSGEIRSWKDDCTGDSPTVMPQSHNY